MSKEEAKVDPLNSKEVNRAAYNFMNLTNEFKNKISNMSLRSIRRTFLAIQEFPFNRTSQPLKKDENDLFIICLAMAENKKIMLEAVEKDEQLKKELEKQAEEIKLKKGEQT